MNVYWIQYLVIACLVLCGMWMIYFVFKPRFEECARRWMTKRIEKSIERLEMWEEYDRERREKRIAKKREQHEKKLAAIAAGDLLVTIKNADGSETYKLLSKEDVQLHKENENKEDLKPSIADLENQMDRFVRSYDEDFKKLQELRKDEAEATAAVAAAVIAAHDTEVDFDNQEKNIDNDRKNQDQDQDQNQNQNQNQNQKPDQSQDQNQNETKTRPKSAPIITKLKLKKEKSRKHKTNRIAPGQSAKAYVEIPNEFKTITQIAKERLKERQQKAEKEFKERMNKIETVAEKVARGKKNYREKLRHNPMGYQMPLGENLHPLYGDLEDRIQNMRHCNFLHKVNLSDRNGLRTPKSRTNVIDHWDNKTAISLTSANK